MLYYLISYTFYSFSKIHNQKLRYTMSNSVCQACFHVVMLSVKIPLDELI